MYNVDFTMKDLSTGIWVTMNLLCDVPDWVRCKRSQLIKSHFARIQCNEFARRFFGTDDVTVSLNVVDGVEYAY